MDQSALLETLDRLLALPRETTTVEFKMNREDAAEIGEYVSALANAAALQGHDRAWMVWGVMDGTHEVVGTTFDPFSKKAEGNQPLIIWLKLLTTPSADFTFHSCDHLRRKVILLEIHPPRLAPIAFRNIRYDRVDSHKTKLSSDREARLFEALGQKSDWSGELVPAATLDDLDPDAIEAARRRFTEYLIKSEPETSRHEALRRNAETWDVATLLNKAKITKGGKITRAALLLLGRDEASHFLSPVDSKISWILRDAKGSMVSSQHFGIPFLLSSDRLFARIRNLTIEQMPDGTLFPVAIQQYDAWVIREALHNSVAHQDYYLGGKINVIETPDRLVFSNLGRFIPPSVEWMLQHQSPPEHYRNQWLIEGMIRLRMIDQMGSGIRRMFETQRERFFPLPDYNIEGKESGLPRVEVAIAGKIMDTKYTQVLMKRSDLDLRHVLLLDRVQKGRTLNQKEAKELKTLKLIEGRSPTYHVSAKVAEWTSQKANYIRTRGLDDGYYQKMVREFLGKYEEATRQDIDNLLLRKLPEVLDGAQKANKIKNLLQAMRRAGIVIREGSRSQAVWKPGPNFNNDLG